MGKKRSHDEVTLSLRRVGQAIKKRRMLENLAQGKGLAARNAAKKKQGKVGVSRLA
ncbi:MAG: hypothetical protein ABTQ34_05445 [Bdellovibrionales bacterium]